MTDIPHGQHVDSIHHDYSGDEQYGRWNEALGRWFFNEHHNGQLVRLSIDPIILFECYADCHGGGEFENDEDAKADFLQSVANELRLRPVAWRPVSPLEKGRLPDFIGLLCAQVLAVSELGKEASEESIGLNNYWERLQYLLPDCAVNQTSANFLRMHQQLWRNGLEHWANSIQERTWGSVELPVDAPGTSRRHVSLPYSQALLRTTDIQASVYLLHDKCVRSSNELSLSYLEKTFLAASGSPGNISRHACRVLLDEARRPQAIEQIQHAFMAWDGTEDSIRKAGSRRGPRATELLVGLNKKLRRLSFQIERLKTGQTCQLPNATAGELFGDTGTRPIQIDDFVFRPRRRRFLLAVRSHVRGTFITQQKIGLEEHGLLLIREQELEKWVEGASSGGVTILDHLSSVDATQHSSTPTAGIVPGWAALVFAVDRQTTRVGEPWCYVIDSRRIRLQPFGGARLDRRTWLSGAGPDIRIRGSSHPSEIDIDGTPHPVCDGIVSSALLSQPGDHTLVVRSAGWGTCAPIRITTRDAHVDLDRLATTGAWTLDGTEWSLFHENYEPSQSDNACVIGMQLFGRPPGFRGTSNHNPRQLAIRLMTARTPFGKHAPSNHAHPIVQALIIRSIIEPTGYE